MSYNKTLKYSVGKKKEIEEIERLIHSNQYYKYLSRKCILDSKYLFTLTRNDTQISVN